MSQGDGQKGGRQKDAHRLTFTQNIEMEDFNEEEYFAEPVGHDGNMEDNAPQFSTFIPPADVPMQKSHSCHVSPSRFDN